MSEESKRRWLGKALGGVVMVMAILAVFLIDWKGKPEEEPELVRPLKTMEITAEARQIVNRFPGKVQAFQQANLSFEVSGTITNLPVQKSILVRGPAYDDQGEVIRPGDLLVQLDSRDFKNALAAAEAQMERARAQLGRIQQAIKVKAVSEQDLSDALAAFEVAEAEVNTRAKALEDTTIRARFDGVIADVFVDTFETIQPKQPILSLQDISRVEIQAILPESRLHQFRPGQPKPKVSAVFDYSPTNYFPLEFKELALEADPITQTYLISYVMANPTNVITVLPGMTVTLVERRSVAAKDSTSFVVPLDLVPVDEVGQYYVWKLKESSEGKLTTHRQDVSVGRLIETNLVVVTKGLKVGDRIAAAGISLLREGRQIQLMKGSN